MAPGMAKEPRGSLRKGSALHSRSRGTGLRGFRWASVAKAPARTADTRPWWSDPSPRPAADRSPAGGDDLVADRPHREPLRDGSEGVAVVLALAQLPAGARP